jgi:hypothetical protein
MTPSALRSLPRWRAAAAPLALVSLLSLPAWLGGCLNGAGSSPPKRLFVTSLKYTGNFGGAQGADSICNTLAAAGVLGGKWSAFLSDDSTGALARISETGPWFRIDRETKIFNNRVGFTVGALAEIYNEYGAAVPTTDRAWTGTRADGTADGTQNCSNWTSNSSTDYGSGGNPNSKLTQGNGPKWMYAAEGAAPCSNLYHLYCFEK